MGDKGGKNDMERVGLFQEMEYITIGDKYTTPGSKPFNEAAAKNKQMLLGGNKTNSALQAGYFEEKFARVMAGEAYIDPVRLRRQGRMEKSKKNLSTAFIPSSGDKKPSGSGNHYGTLGGPVGAFSPASRPGNAYKSPGRNILTNPPKKGTGYGYPNLLVGKDYTYSSTSYDRGKELRRKERLARSAALKGQAFQLNMHPRTYFDSNPYYADKELPPLKKPSAKQDVKPFRPSHPAKIIGGSKAGTFDPYPSHSNDPYKQKVAKGPKPMNSSGNIFMPSPGSKSAPTTSIVNQNVFRSINSSNFRTYGTTMASA